MWFYICAASIAFGMWGLIGAGMLTILFAMSGMAAIVIWGFSAPKTTNEEQRK